MTTIVQAVELALDAGDLTRAQHWVETHARWLDWCGGSLWRADQHLLQARLHEAAGDLTRSRQAAEHALDVATHPRQPLRLLAAHRLLGRLDTRERRYDQAQDHLTTALVLADACVALFERARTLLAHAELQAVTGQRDSALKLLAEARGIASELDARPTLIEIDAATTGLDAPPARASFPNGLTAREVDVLRLVARGLTDAEVAEQLFMARRTVNTHLTSIYTKLGVSSRAAATRWAVEQGLS
jgi:DNA-binding CsgD family transcriptional regulator